MSRANNARNDAKGSFPPCGRLRDNGQVTSADPDATSTPMGDETPPRSRKVLLFAVVAVLVFVLDVVSKSIVVATLEHQPPVRLLGGAVYLVLARNSGAAFSVGTGATVVLTVVAIVVVVVILRAARRLYSASWAVALGLVLGGAVGNLTDRILRDAGRRPRPRGRLDQPVRQ